MWTVKDSGLSFRATMYITCNRLVVYLQTHQHFQCCCITWKRKWTSNAGLTNLSSRPVAGCCHLANITARCQSHCSSILKVSLQQLWRFAAMLNGYKVTKPCCKHRKPKNRHPKAAPQSTWHIQVAGDIAIYRNGPQRITTHYNGRQRTSADGIGRQRTATDHNRLTTDRNGPH